jgi:hypothetical protein
VWLYCSDTNAGKVIAARGIKAVRDQTVVVKPVKRTAYKKRKPKELLEQELSGVPLDACVSHGEVQAISMQQQMKQDYLMAKSDAPTTAPKGVYSRVVHSVAEQFRMRSGPHKVDGIALHLENQQEVATDMALPMIGPLTFQSVVQPLGPQRFVIGD